MRILFKFYNINVSVFDFSERGWTEAERTPPLVTISIILNIGMCIEIFSMKRINLKLSPVDKRQVTT